ncbi:solute carrier family 66 (lysosomal lysine-arginine transporter), member 1, partial [Lecanoromycetidae sp. Uapishka_2]
MSPTINLDIESLSGICGSISIACWVVVFSPQIIENFRRSSADGLSLQFIIVWLLGDVFNILGAVLQNVLPTMTILAVYYTVADIVLLGQCFWYRGFTLSDAVEEVTKPVVGGADEEAVAEEDGRVTEESALLPHHRSLNMPERPSIADVDGAPKRGSFSSLHSRFSGNVDATHLSPATPFIPPPKPTDSPPAVSNTKVVVDFEVEEGAVP